jgi:cephalosporin hydroxylase
MIKIDLEKGLIENEGQMIPLGSPQGFSLISKIWLRAGWDTKYVYTFSWMGRPVIQLPEDMLRIQEVIYQVQPDVVVETGVAHGGSLIFYASLFKALGKGRVIGVDIEIRKHNRKAIEEHPLFPYITLIEGSSTAPQTVALVNALIKPGEKVLVILDSCHTYDHVLSELNAYSPLVSPNSYIVSTDGIMKDLVGAPRSQPDWATNNPYHAAQDFLLSHPDFQLEQPKWLFDESQNLAENVTYWPGSYLKRLK